MDRRRFLTGAGLFLAAGGLPLGRAQGRAPKGVNGGGFYRFRVGGIQAVVLSDGQSPPGPLLPNWGANPELQEAFRRTLVEHFLDPEATRNNFNPVLLDLGEARLLVDTGRGAGSGGRLLAHLELAGYLPEDITHVCLTHGHPDSAGVPASFARETIVLPYNDTAALDAAFAANPGQIACVILEPYCGNVGFIMPDVGYLAAVRAITARHGALLIFDEVMTGFRLHKAGVQGLLNEELAAAHHAAAASASGSPGSALNARLPFAPDLTCLGKIIGGGLPVGAFGGRSDIMDHLAPLGPVYQAGTLSGNPLAMAAGIAALRLLEDDGSGTSPYTRLDRLGRQLRDAVLAAARTKGIPAQVPQCGSMFSIFFTATPVRDYATALTGDAKLFARFFHACLARGVYLAPSAYEAGFISTAHEGSSIDRACEIMSQAIAEL